MTGAYESDMGLWSTDAAGLLRERRRFGADRVAMFMNVTPEFATSLGTRSVGEVARSAVMSSLADAILVSGPRAGRRARHGGSGSGKDGRSGPRFRCLANTGAKSSNVASFLEAADGIIVGSDLKRDGYTWNPVDADRVKSFMQAAGRLGVGAASS